MPKVAKLVAHALCCVSDSESFVFVTFLPSRYANPSWVHHSLWLCDAVALLAAVGLLTYIITRFIVLCSLSFWSVGSVNAEIQ